MNYFEKEQLKTWLFVDVLKTNDCQSIELSLLAEVLEKFLDYQIPETVPYLEAIFQSNFYSILLAPLYRLLGDWSQRQQVVISHRSHGRDLGEGQSFMESMGNYAVNFPIGINLSTSTTWQKTISTINEQFESLPMNGVTYDWIGESLPEYLYPDSNLTPVRANYLGNRSVPLSVALSVSPSLSHSKFEVRPPLH